MSRGLTLYFFKLVVLARGVLNYITEYRNIKLSSVCLWA